MEKVAAIVNAWWKIIVILFFVGMLWTEVQQVKAEIEAIKPICTDVYKIDGRVTSLEQSTLKDYEASKEFQKEMRQELKEIKSLLISLGGK